MEVVALSSGPLSAEVLPGLGGSLGSLAWRGEPVLRGWDGRTRDPNATAMYPLVPWSNRISGGGFRHGGRFHALAANRGGEPFPIHGYGWLAPWAVIERGREAVRLAHEHRVGDGFRYRATLDYALREGGLEVTLAVTHEGSVPLPYGLGLHPWLPRDRGPVLLEAPASAVWLEGPGHLPAARLAPPPEEWDFGAARALPSGWTNNAFEGWAGHARAGWPRRGLELVIEADAGLGCYMLHTPVGEDFWCFEPVSHVPDAHNRDQAGLRVLAPGESWAVGARFRVYGGCAG